VNDFLRLGGIVVASLGSAMVVQHLWDRHRERALGRAIQGLGLAPRPVAPLEDLRSDLPFLSALEGNFDAAGATGVWEGSRAGAQSVLLTMRASSGTVLGYTLLAWRAPAWSARVILRAKKLRGGPPEGSPDQQRFAKLDRAPLRTALATAGAWLHIEGPWRVVAIPEPVSPRVVARLEKLSKEVATLVPEPDEFAGGLEWNV
jgi:hypothetical protein